MPELPEVETAKQGITPFILGKKIINVAIRQHALRWPIAPDLAQQLQQQKIVNVSRRGKYLILQMPNAALLIHLGMSGSLRIVDYKAPLKKHDHVDIIFSRSIILRYHDPRRFGCILLCKNPDEHPLLSSLGVEPLSTDFNEQYLFKLARLRKVPVKSLIMNSKIVVGVGNIYANEALFVSKIHPLIPSNELTQQDCRRLVKAIISILTKAIAEGGTTLKDFVNSEGNPGYFSQKLNVYGRRSLPCPRCKHALEEIRLNQRSTVYCPACQIYRKLYTSCILRGRQ